jgi:hypothetical protein
MLLAPAAIPFRRPSGSDHHPPGPDSAIGERVEKQRLGPVSKSLGKCRSLPKRSEPKPEQRSALGVDFDNVMERQRLHDGPRW